MIVRDVEAEFNLVAESYADPSLPAHGKECLSQRQGTLCVLMGTVLPSCTERSLFFAKVDFDTSNDVFHKYDFKGVPIIIHVSHEVQRVKEPCHEREELESYF